MRPFRTTSAIHRGNIVRRGPHPYFLSLVGSGQLPDAQVMALGKSVERFLEDQVGRPTGDQQRRNGRAGVPTLPQGSLRRFQGRFYPEIVGGKPSCLAKRGNQLL